MIYKIADKTISVIRFRESFEHTTRQVMTINIYYVYILHCENDSYYTGYTNDIARRYQSHLDGTGKCKYTKSFKPLKLVRCWEIQGEKALAMRIERYIKKLSRVEKEKLIKKPTLLVNLYPEGKLSYSIAK